MLLRWAGVFSSLRSGAKFLSGHVLESEPVQTDLLDESSDSDFPSCVRDLQYFLC